jgi:farnesyl diphosphate synthase
VSVLGLQRARAHAEALRDSAHAALARSGLTDAARLSLLADKVVDRDC